MVNVNQIILDIKALSKAEWFVAFLAIVFGNWLVACFVYSLQNPELTQMQVFKHMVGL